MAAIYRPESFSPAPPPPMFALPIAGLITTYFYDTFLSSHSEPRGSFNKPFFLPSYIETNKTRRAVLVCGLICTLASAATLISELAIKIFSFQALFLTFITTGLIAHQLYKLNAVHQKIEKLEARLR